MEYGTRSERKVMQNRMQRLKCCSEQLTPYVHVEDCPSQNQPKEATLGTPPRSKTALLPCESGTGILQSRRKSSYHQAATRVHVGRFSLLQLPCSN